MRLLYYLLQITWGLPQNLLGGLLWLLLRLTGQTIEAAEVGDCLCPICRSYRYAVVTGWKMEASMGLGCFIFLGTGDQADPERILVHEYGHTIQSLILGPAFLPVIGLPSVIWSNLPALAEYRRSRGMSYYHFYPERWANRLGERVTGGRGPS